MKSVSIAILVSISLVTIFGCACADNHSSASSGSAAMKKNAHVKSDEVPPPGNVQAYIASAYTNTVTWAGDQPYFTVQRRTSQDGQWTGWETIDTKDTGTHKFNDAQAPINTDTQYRIGSWNDESTPPDDSQWGESNIVKNPG